ncbi:MAG: hypothetical protein KatS3mg014_2531 [Actinomycetota bacterium]|nr:MAG: hypothetical protein KatS3mg014_2474 [Actinomycetota bacterium]GIV00916.1 MAG: hypothetical protein KatS3mg014_2531 [Actinomycetota bacterium]
MATECAGQVQACAIRVVRLAADGSPIQGPDNMVVSDALVSLTATPVYTDGDEVELKNACGSVVVSAIGDDSFKRIDVTLEIARPDPHLAELLSTGDVLSPPSGAPKGFAFPAIGPITDYGVSIELWAKRIVEGTQDSAYPWWRWLFPRVKNLRLGERRIENGVLVSTYSGRAFGNPEWLDGPEGDWPYPTVPSDRPAQYIPAATIPTVTCGYLTTSGS